MQVVKLNEISTSASVLVVVMCSSLLRVMGHNRGKPPEGPDHLVAFKFLLLIKKAVYILKFSF